VDLFSRWAETGSAQAERLASLSLTASGFVQRKPERIQAALQRLQASEPLEMATALACQQLLLGQVEQARELMGESLGTAEALSDDDPLARLCSVCRDWLSREVLPGFRDIDAEADLDAWFADRDVQAYIEQQDRIRGRQVSSAPAAAQDSWIGLDSVPPPAFGAESPAATAPHGSDSLDAEEDELLDEHEALWEPWAWRDTLARWRQQLPQHWPRWMVPAGAAVAVALAGGLLWAGLRGQRQPVRPIPVQASTPASPSPTKPPTPPTTSPALPLTSAEPTDAQLKVLLTAWLDAKAAVLAGQPSAQPLSELARPLLVRRLELQHQENRSRQEMEAIEATLQSLEVRERSPRRIAAAVTLRYSDQRRAANGQVLSQTPSSELRNIYVFARDGESWHVAAYRPGS